VEGASPCTHPSFVFFKKIYKIYFSPNGFMLLISSMETSVLDY